MMSMGNFQKGFKKNSTSEPLRKMIYTPVNEFKFHDFFDGELTNGLFLSNVYIPEELIVNILSYVPPRDLLALTLVCKKWCNLIKSDGLWMDIYNRQHTRKGRNLPWFVYYNYFTTDNFCNLVKNGNGQEQFKHWRILKNFGDEFKIENPPLGSDPLPPNIPDFNGHTGCFVTSYYECYKVQEISLRNKRLLMYIMNKFMPHIYVSEWMAGRFDCGCKYRLAVRGYTKNNKEEGDLACTSKEEMDLSCISEEQLDLEDTIQDEEEDEQIPAAFNYSTPTKEILQWQGREWQKVEILVKEYPTDVINLLFEHEGSDTQFWKGHYGSKMAGGVLRFIFDSIEPLEDTGVTKARELYKPLKQNIRI